MKKPPAVPLDFRNTNALWCSVLVETLVRLGARHAVTCPGSRSTPLTLALARHPGIEVTPVLDERSAAFFALGLGKRTRRPAILVCTSGTAGANFHPAVIEAWESGVPLLVITADRPPEMRECRSGQTIDQQKLFGDHVAFYHELAAPEPALPMLRYLRQTTAHAWQRAQGGPVHLNAPFRDPLPPLPDGRTGAVRRALKPGQFFAGLTVTARPTAAVVLDDALGALRRKRGVIVAGYAGPADPAAYAANVGRIAAALGWPVLADALSPARHFDRYVPHLVTAYDPVPRDRRLAAALQPEAVLVLDNWPTSKALRQWLGALDLPGVVISPATQNPDALHGRMRRVPAAVEDVVAGEPFTGSPVWTALWNRAEQLLRRGLTTGARRTGFEGGIVPVLADAVPAGTAVFVANSMPVRDAEYFWPPNDRGCAVLCNRGANGIDGTLSTALGVAQAGGAAVLLAGDLAFLHDSNGLLLRPEFRGSLTVVLVNNAGGGIFNHLPIAEFEPPFERLFATPQQADFARLCAAHGVAHMRVKDFVQLGRLLARLPRRGIRVLEVRTDRRKDAAWRKKLFADVSARVGKQMR